MPKIFYTEDEYESLKHEKEQLIKKVAGLESLRPIWALGATQEIQDAYSASAALYTLWSKLMVSDQTGAVQQLDSLIARSKELNTIRGKN